MFPGKESFKMQLTTEQNSSWNGSLQLNVFPPPKKVPHLHWPTTTTFRNHKHTDWSTRTIITSYCIDLPVNWKSPPPPPQMCFGCSPSFDRVPVHYVSLPFLLLLLLPLWHTITAFFLFGTVPNGSSSSSSSSSCLGIIINGLRRQCGRRCHGSCCVSAVTVQLCVCVCVLSLGGLFCLC